MNIYIYIYILNIIFIGDLEEEYEKSKVKMEEASNDAIFNFQKKKGVAVERKELKEQKEEVQITLNYFCYYYFTSNKYCYYY